MANDFLPSTAIILVTFILSLGLTHWIRKALLKRDMLDRPNERSSHTIPVPRGGGWALLIVLIPALLLTSILQHNFAAHAGLLAGLIGLAIISALDDRRNVSPVVRLALHIGAAFFGSLAFPSGAVIFGGVLPLWLDRTVMVIGWAWFINLYNFMDGIDGITCSETIALATGTCLVMTATGLTDPYASTLTLLLTGVSLGFLAFNWHPAKIFLGDVGSVPLGYLTGFLLIGLAMKGYLVAALILPLYYLADSGITITKRALRGEKIWQAHRQHFYQRAALAAGRHDKVVSKIIVADGLLIGSAMLAIVYPMAGLALGCVITAGLLRKMAPWDGLEPPTR